MRTFVPSLLVLGALVLVNIIGAIALVAAEKLALYLDPAANESHLSGFIVAVSGVAVAVASAFPDFRQATALHRRAPCPQLAGAIAGGPGRIADRVASQPQARCASTASIAYASPSTLNAPRSILALSDATS